MTTTINISLPKQLYKAAKKLVEEEKYSSISEIVRAGLRRVTDEADKITENGFPGWFEDQVLEAAAEPIDKSKVWKTEEDIEKYFEKFHNKIKSRIKRGRDDKSQTSWQIHQVTG
ncbi:hypothetical protein HYU96_00855 [Candidatus Daviesbacteria bacterium]|nr:hypothetical protein [Candidatus Daviesbacteria bacterium]